MTRALLEGNEARTTHGAQTRDLLHVEDVAGAWSRSSTRTPRGRSTWLRASLCDSVPSSSPWGAHSRATPSSHRRAGCAHNRSAIPRRGRPEVARRDWVSAQVRFGFRTERDRWTAPRRSQSVTPGPPRSRTCRSNRPLSSPGRSTALWLLRASPQSRLGGLPTRRRIRHRRAVHARRPDPLESASSRRPAPRLRRTRLIPEDRRRPLEVPVAGPPSSPLGSIVTSNGTTRIPFAACSARGRRNLQHRRTEGRDLGLNANVHPILDFHTDEVGRTKDDYRRSGERLNIFWEGVRRESHRVRRGSRRARPIVETTPVALHLFTDWHSRSTAPCRVADAATTEVTGRAEFRRSCTNGTRPMLAHVATACDLALIPIVMGDHPYRFEAGK